jgi:hypothetical protein
MATKNGRPESRPRLSPTRQFFRLRITADKKRLCGAPGGEDTVDAGHSDVELCRDSLAGLALSREPVDVGGLGARRRRPAFVSAFPFALVIPSR